MRLPRFVVLLTVLTTIVMCSFATPAFADKWTDNFKAKAKEARQRMNHAVDRARDNLTREYQRYAPIVESHGRAVAESARRMAEQYGPAAGQRISDIYDRYGPQAAEHIRAAYDLYGPRIADRLAVAYETYGPVAADALQSAYARYGPEAGQRILAIYEQYGPEVGGSIRSAYDSLGPAVGESISNACSLYGPRVAESIRLAYEECGPGVGEIVLQAANEYGPRAAQGISHAYVRYGPAVGGKVAECFREYGPKIGERVVEQAELVGQYLSSPEPWAICVGVSLAISDQTGTTKSVEELTRVIENSELAQSAKVSTEHLGDRYGALYVFAALDERELLDQIRPYPGDKESVREKVRAIRCTEQAELLLQIDVAAQLETIRGAIREGKPIDGPMKQLVELTGRMQHGS